MHCSAPKTSADGWLYARHPSISTCQHSILYHTPMAVDIRADVPSPSSRSRDETRPRLGMKSHPVAQANSLHLHPPGWGPPPPPLALSNESCPTPVDGSDAVGASGAGAGALLSSSPHTTLFHSKIQTHSRATLGHTHTHTPIRPVHILQVTSSPLTCSYCTIPYRAPPFRRRALNSCDSASPVP